MAKPYKEGKGWCVRARHEGHDIYLSGYPTKAKVNTAVAKRITAIDEGRAPREPGPEATTLAQALQTYALECLRFLKGAVQDAVRINHYLRYAGLDLLEVQRIAPEGQGGANGSGSTVYFSVCLKPRTEARKIPNGLGAHRKAQLTKNANTEKHRAVLARKRMPDISRSDVQQLFDAMRDDNNAPATVALERAMLRGLFNYVRTNWRWLEDKENPATAVKMPRVDNVRKRSMSAQEQAAMDLAISSCRNKLVGPTVALLRETAMRTSEPLTHAQWKDVDWARRVLTIDGKTGRRDVPLSPAALDALHALRELNPGAPDDPIVYITYEALRGAWNDACKRAGVTDLQLYDLRRTAATRMGLKTGNVFLVQALTGHKTLEMAMRYMNVTADDAVAVLHAAPQAKGPEVGTQQVSLAPAAANAAPVTLTMEQLQALVAMATSANQAPAAQNVIEVLQGEEGAANVVQLAARRDARVGVHHGPTRNTL